MGDTVGIAVLIFDEPGWLTMCRESDDGIDTPYEEYMAEVEWHAGELASRGFLVHRVDCDAVELIEWCRRQGRPLDGRARAEYGAMLAQRRSRH